MYTLIQGAKLQKKWHKMGEKNKINILPDGIWNGEVGGVDIVIARNSTKYTVYYIYQNFFNNTHPVFPQLLSAICPRVYYVMIFQLGTYTKD